MATPEIGQMTGCSVIDPDAQKVGTVKDVVYDDRTMEMRWAVVEYGHGLAQKPRQPIPEISLKPDPLTARGIANAAIAPTAKPGAAPSAQPERSTTSVVA